MSLLNDLLNYPKKVEAEQKKIDALRTDLDDTKELLRKQIEYDLHSKYFEDVGDLLKKFRISNPTRKPSDFTVDMSQVVANPSASNPSRVIIRCPNIYSWV